MPITPMHNPAQLFRGLERTIGLIARHPYFPGKEDAVSRCGEEIEQRYRQGMLTDGQRTRLLAILRDTD
jgi:hypothetical protein